MKAKFLKLFTLANIGGISYCSIELLWRCRTHWTMYILAAMLFLFLGSINEYIPWEMSLVKQSIIGTTGVVIMELFTGLIVNVWLGWNVWDYSTMKLNFLGQVCVEFTILWIPLSAFAIIADDWLRYWLFNEERPHYKII